MSGNSTAPKVMLLTPEEASRLLEHNTLNRPLNDQHVKRLANQIIAGKWRFNGDTIKISDDHQVLDGQHRLWAVLEAKTAITTIIVGGIARDAFATIDTLRKPRSGGDVLALMGATGNKSSTAAALTWLIRWQKGILETYKQPAHRIENSDIEHAFINNPGITRALERCSPLRGTASPALVGFFYYILSNRSPELAERMVYTMENPAGIAMSDPYFRLRMYFVSDHQRKDALVTIALMIKATNAAYHGREIKVLRWQNQGQNPEEFPRLEVITHNTPV
jgi:hypothetical protein